MSLLVDDIKSIASEVLNEARPSKIQVGQYQADGSIVSDINVNPYPPEAIIIPRHILYGTRRFAFNDDYFKCEHCPIKDFTWDSPNCDICLGLRPGEDPSKIFCGKCPDLIYYPDSPNCSLCLGLRPGDNVLFVQDHGGQKLIVLGIV